MSEWIEVERDTEEKEKDSMWEPEAIGESIQGIYIEKEEDVGQYKSNLYNLKTKDEGEKKFWGSTVLDELMGKVPLGHEVLIIYQGKQPSKKGKNPWKDYKVQHRPVEK
ncbi:MAG TPA: hypothetical protein VK444_09245 [Methanobacteriaceae archaeon]|nr:hypothetical protein [Methanobacteriaceae archaeon]